MEKIINVQTKFCDAPVVKSASDTVQQYCIAGFYSETFI